MRYLSLFSGIEAATLAWSPLGWECAGVAEIEPFCCDLLRHYYPTVPNLGDVTRITDRMIADLGPIDIVIGGSPCQDLSVAGKRAGLAGERSSLFHEQVRIFDAAAAFCGARFLVWENVPGAFSLNDGRDFACVVGALAGSPVVCPTEGWGNEGVALGPKGLVEWAVLDAQWFNLAQRRARVFVVLDTGEWSRRPPILLEPDRLRGDSPPSREAGARIARPLAAGSDSSGGYRNGGHDLETRSDGTANAVLTPSGGRAGIGVGAVAYGIDPQLNCEREAIGPLNIGSATGGGQPARVGVLYQDSQYGVGEYDTGGALRAGRIPEHQMVLQPHTVAFAQNQRDEVRQMDVAGALASEPGMKQQTYLQQAMQVRRLTPREAERLQGFPDDYTLIPVKGKPAADGPRYRGLGNSMPVPVIRWIGRRIQAAVATGG